MSARTLLLAIVCGGALLPGALRADEIILKNGNRFKGRVIKEADGKVTFECDVGVITLKASKIKEIKRGPWVREEAVPEKAKPARPAPRRRTGRRAAPT